MAKKKEKQENKLRFRVMENFFIERKFQVSV